MGQAYFWFVGLFAVVVAISIAGLFVRRFVTRPVWLGKVSPESGVIAILIFVLMVTYLAEFALSQGSPGGKTNWWIHTLALLIFLPLIPHTKHLHLILSPAAILRNEPDSARFPRWKATTIWAGDGEKILPTSMRSRLFRAWNAAGARSSAPLRLQENC